MPRSPLVDHKPEAAKAIPPVAGLSGRNVVSRVSATDGTRLTADRREFLRKMYETSEDVKGRPVYMYAVPPWRKGREPQRISFAERVTQAIPSRYGRDSFRVLTHGLAETGVLALKTLDIPSRLFGHERSRLRDWYEKIEAGVARDKFETDNAFFPIASTAVNLASAGIYGKALAPMFGANVGVDTYELAKETGAQEGGALATGTAHGIIDTAIWTLGQGLASRYLPKAWQWLGRELAGAMRGAASSVTSDTVLNSLGADISGEEMTKHAVHAAWMVPVLGMLKMGGKRRAEAMSLLKKARPDLAGMKADKVIETIEAEFGDPKSQKVALAWVARKGANLPDDVAQIRQALEVASKVKGLDPMSKSPFEILSDPRYVRYLPKPRPQDVKAFSNMKRYPMGVIGFDVSDDAAGRQATREMINAYMSPSSNPWCLATGKDAARLGELGPGAEGYWKQHSAVPKQIFFQEVDGKLELTAFRATSRGGEGRQEYWDTSDAGYSGIPIKVKVPGDPMGRYRKMVFRPADSQAPIRVKLPMYSNGRYSDVDLRRMIALGNNRLELERERPGQLTPEEIARQEQEIREARQGLAEIAETRKKLSSGEVQGTFEDIAPGKVFKGDPFRDGMSQTWVLAQTGARGSRIGPTNHESTARQRLSDLETMLREGRRPMTRGDDPWYNDMTGVRFVELTDGDRAVIQKEIADLKANLDALDKGSYVLVEDKVRTTENGITKFRTTKYADPTDPDLGLYEGDENLKVGQPVEIEESELVSPEWMRSRGYDPESESDVRRMQQELDIQAWGNGVEAAMAVVPTRRTYMQTKSGTPETVTYGPNGRAIMAVDFVKDGVSYKEEYDYAGPNWDMESPYDLYPGDSFYQLPRPEYGVSLTTGAVNRRLIRNPGTERAEVLDDVRVDEGLGGFVRTSGNRRWRTTGLLGADGISDPEARRRVQAVEAELAARLARFNSVDPPDLGPVSSMGPVIVDGREVLSAQRAANVVAWTRTHQSFRENEVFPLYYGLQYEAPGWLPRREGWPSASDIAVATGTPRVIVEDRQPDGTWVPAVDRRVNAETGEVVELPPPPAAVRTSDTQVDDVPFALKAGRTRRNVRAAEGGGDTPGASGAPVPEGSAPAQPGGPRIVLNPAVFHDKRDALCVAFNEAFRIVCEMNGFEPVSEPTEKQRKFFADTAYANDELQLRRTILARIATLDTSVSDPTDEQLEETVEMLEMVMEVGAPQNEWEQQAVQRLHDVVAKAREGHVQNEEQPEAPQDEASTQADVGGGVTDDETRFRVNPVVPGIYGFDTKAQYDSWSLKDAPGKVGDVRWVSIADGKTPDSPTSVFKQTYGEHGWSGEATVLEGNAEVDELYKLVDEELEKPAGYKLWDGGKDQTTRTIESAVNFVDDAGPGFGGQAGKSGVNFVDDAGPGFGGQAGKSGVNFVDDAGPGFTAGKSGNNLTGDAPSIVPDEPTDGVVVGPGGRKTYTDAQGRRITKNAWRKLHGLA